MQDWMIVVVIAVVVIFGASKLPQLARNVGKAQTEFKKGLKEGASEAEVADDPASTAPAATTPTDPAPPVSDQQAPPPATQA